jgi:hypothetical protein
MSKTNVSVTVPAGMFGAVPGEPLLDSAMRAIGVAIEKASGADDWAEKYGSNYDCDEFMMHPFCWCERSDCPWCRSCECPDSAFHYLVDGAEVSYDEWMAFYESLVKWPDFPRDNATQQERAEYNSKRRHMEKVSAAANKRRSTRHDPVCESCTKYGDKTEPNFHHKPSGLKVWWYKYIGRSMKVEGGDGVDLVAITQSCLAALTPRAKAGDE